MDGASAIAGLISLAALTLTLTSKMYDTVCNLRDIPTRFQQELEWLARLRDVLISVNDTCIAIDQSNATVNTILLHQTLRTCSTSMQALDEQIRTQVHGLQRRGLSSKIELAKAVFRSERFKKSKDNISQCLTDLRFSHQQLST